MLVFIMTSRRLNKETLGNHVHLVKFLSVKIIWKGKWCYSVVLMSLLTWIIEISLHLYIVKTCVTYKKLLQEDHKAPLQRYALTDTKQEIATKNHTHRAVLHTIFLILKYVQQLMVGYKEKKLHMFWICFLVTATTRFSHCKAYTRC